MPRDTPGRLAYATNRCRGFALIAIGRGQREARPLLEASPQEGTIMPRAILTTLVLAVGVAHAGLDCRGVFDSDTDRGHFRCRFQGERLRRVRADCRDGQPGCDADGTCNASCRFALCADAACRDTVGIDVPLRNGGRARGKVLFQSADARVVLRCFPRRGPCRAAGTTSTTTPPSTTTTLPARPCRAMLTGAVDASLPCITSLERSPLGLPLLEVSFHDMHTTGVAAAFLTKAMPGSYRLGPDLALAVVALEQPPLGSFLGAHEDASHHVMVRLDSVDGSQVHGRLDAMLPATSMRESVRLQADF
jgi:hypothetical protein